MKEIKILHQNLRNYPDNLFVYPQEADSFDLEKKAGLVVVTAQGEEVGFIELGEEGNVIL